MKFNNHTCHLNVCWAPHTLGEQYFYGSDHLTDTVVPCLGSKLLPFKCLYTTDKLCHGDFDIDLKHYFATPNISPTPIYTLTSCMTHILQFTNTNTSPQVI